MTNYEKFKNALEAKEVFDRFKRTLKVVPLPDDLSAEQKESLMVLALTKCVASVIKSDEHLQNLVGGAASDVLFTRLLQDIDFDTPVKLSPEQEAFDLLFKMFLKGLKINDEADKA